MSQIKKAVFNWSGGKDSAMALREILKNNSFEVVSLLTTIDADSQKSSIHNIPLDLLKKQADSIGIPLYTVNLSKHTQNYEEGMLLAVEHFQKLGVNHFIFGDLYLEDVKQYREEKLNSYSIHVVEPLWGSSGQQYMNDFFDSGLKTIIVTTQADKLGKNYIGKPLNSEIVLSFPSDVDPCGENGEYHTFCYDGDIFSHPVDFDILSVKELTHSFKMEDGEIKDFHYWQAELK